MILIVPSLSEAKDARTRFQVYHPAINMAVLRLDIEGNPREVRFRTLLDTGARTLYMLGEIDSAISRGRASIEWLVDHVAQNGLLRIEIRSSPRHRKKPESDVGEKIAATFVRGFAAVEQEASSPPFLTDTGMKRALRMTRDIGSHGVQAIVAAALQSEEQIRITRKSEENLSALIPPAAHSLGSVEGRLEAISIHGKPRFVVYQSRTGKAVSCYFSGAQGIASEAVAALGRRVVVFGRLDRNQKGEPIRISISPDRDERPLVTLDDYGPSLLALGGRDPDFTGALSTFEFIRKARG